MNRERKTGNRERKTEMSGEMVGERIRSIRTLLDISQKDLADTTQVSQSLISQVENGAKEATDELVASIAEATATPRSFFYVTPPDVPMGTLRFRKRASARTADTKRFKALFDEAYRLVTELLQEVSYPKPDLPVVDWEPSYDDIEKAAISAREALQLPDDSPVSHITRACERAGIPIIPLALHTNLSEDDSPAGHFGISCWVGKDEPAVVGYLYGMSGDRQRFTIAHELGHLILHSRRRVVRYPEDEANYFAGALLIPQMRAEEMFSGEITLSDLQRMKAHWGVSIQSLIMRGAHLGLIDEQRKTSLFKQMSSRGWRRSEPVTVHPEEPALTWTLLSRKFGKPVAYHKIAEQIGLGAFMSRSFAPQPPKKSSSKASQQ